MRIPRWLAWSLITLTFLTAGLIRQFHEEIPTSPYISPAAGSLLFASVLFLLLVSAREQRLGAARGPGVRLGSLTPLLLMLLGEKWVSLTLYHPTFYWISPASAPPPLLDAYYRAFSGAGLLAVVLLVSRFSAPSGRRAWRCSRPALWPWAAGAWAQLAEDGAGNSVADGGRLAVQVSRGGRWDVDRIRLP